MKRAATLAVLALLATAAPASAAGQPKSPIHATVSISPPVQLFGDTVTARVAVVADTTRVDPARVRVTAKFAPYTPVGPPQKVQSASGRDVLTTWTWTLHCVTATCVPLASPDGLSQDFHFPPVQVRAVGAHSRALYKLHVFMPPLKAVSQISPREMAHIEKYKHIDWLYQAGPAGTAYRLSPNLVFWLAVALAVICGAAAVAVAARWALRFRAASVAQAGLPSSYLERALALFFWANAHGDETLQRKALERVADELPLDELDLSEVARELAWSPETPEGEAVEAISQHAGVDMHPNGGGDA